MAFDGTVNRAGMAFVALSAMLCEGVLSNGTCLLRQTPNLFTLG